MSESKVPSESVRYLAGETLPPAPLVPGRRRTQQIPDAAREAVSRHDVRSSAGQPRTGCTC